MTATQILVVDDNLVTPVWEPPLPPTDLIFDDGEPLESNHHRIAMNTLIDSYHQFRGEARDYFVGGNMFVYYSSAQVRNRDYRGPDFFVVLDAPAKPESRQGWVVWEEEGRYPNLIVELLSPSTEVVDRGFKKNLYERTFKCGNYFIYDPFNPDSLEGWQLIEEHYQPLVKDERGWLWSSILGLWLGPWQGEVLKETTVWLRFYDQAGNLVPLPNEVAQMEHQRAEAERQRAEAEHQRAEAEHQQAQMERQRADSEQRRADDEQQRADNEKNRADTEQQRASKVEQENEQLRARLLALGIEP